ncbi:hypothetical protein R3P38DRAFT_2762483 [Favolaschia claudopus]|uniref:DUF7330 domain-containing protein n=1 Tax=Favolaschia claudopus TaxID=2862362 RepID=A0AAW0DJV4_9AGAR
MLLPSPKVVEQTIIAVNVATIPDEPPPAYVPEASTSGASARTADVSPRPTNFLSLIRASAPITGSFIIDPNIRIPEALLPDTVEPRRNLYLETTGAPIDVDIFVVGENTSSNMPVDIHLQANGPITARIHASPSIARPHIHLTAYSSAPISIAVPAFFRGPLTIRSSRPSSSPSLPPQATIFSEAENTRRGFIGDFTDWTRDSAGDELDLESASVSISVMEVEEDQQRENTNPNEPRLNPTDPFAWLKNFKPAHLQHPLHLHHYMPHLAHEHRHLHAAPFQPGPPSVHQGLPAQWGRLGGRGPRLGRGGEEVQEQRLGGQGQGQGQSFDPLTWMHYARGRGRGRGFGRGFGQAAISPHSLGPTAPGSWW